MKNAPKKQKMKTNNYEEDENKEYTRQEEEDKQED